MTPPLKAKDVLDIQPDSKEARELESKLKYSIIVNKSVFRRSNQAFWLGLFFVLVGLYILYTSPDQKISEGFGGVSVHGLFLTSGIVLMSWFKTGEILKAVGEFISKARGGNP
ncbi:MULTISPECIES: hypothetical protein [Leptospira]|uniref:Uncharacterized protein n=1 Tax=Leptospira weilii str. UI 13098 TaxID=1088542 RepID=M6Q8E1_9LEPT|nr:MULTISPECIES: hypothetical protein [Leptospira]EMJ62106.1 hypothetical protein LEP1GSC051_0162 [Leptospira sp. P2653]EMN89435.1 hypothetical protein LEP1GSC108_0345 [Leptospira weilii str. UI 13098]